MPSCARRAAFPRFDTAVVLGLCTILQAQRYYFCLISPSVPLFFAIGNHGGEQGRYLNGTTDDVAVWSNTLRKLYLPNPAPNEFYTGNENPDPVSGMLQDYYTWQWGDTRFVVLDPFWYTSPRKREDLPAGNGRLDRASISG